MAEYAHIFVVTEFDNSFMSGIIMHYLFRDMCSMNLSPYLTACAHSVMKSRVRVSAKAAVSWKLPHNTCVCLYDAASV